MCSRPEKSHSSWYSSPAGGIARCMPHGALPGAGDTSPTVREPVFTEKAGIPAFSEREVIGAEIASVLRPRVGFDLQLEPSRSLLDQRPHGGALRAGDHHLCRLTRRVERVKVQIDGGLFDRNQRMGGVVFASPQAALLAVTARNSAERRGFCGSEAQARAISISIATPVALSTAHCRSRRRSPAGRSPSGPSARCRSPLPRASRCPERSPRRCECPSRGSSPANVDRIRMPSGDRAKVARFGQLQQFVH